MIQPARANGCPSQREIFEAIHNTSGFGVSGANISLPVMGTFEIDGELIRAWRDYFDLDSYRRQLPASMPPPGG